MANSGDYDATFRRYLLRVQKTTEKLIFEDSDVDAMYGISRTPRKTATTRAQRAGLGGEVEKMNRWRKAEMAANRRIRHRMSALYSEAVLMMPTTWLVSHAL